MSNKHIKTFALIPIFNCSFRYPILILFSITVSLLLALILLPTTPVITYNKPANSLMFLTDLEQTNALNSILLRYIFCLKLLEISFTNLKLSLSILILIIGVSRIYLGVHYFTDVLGGYILGLIYLVLIKDTIKE